MQSRDALSVFPNVYHEHAVYLRYICAFYNDLPPLSIFLHGHRTSWHSSASPITKVRQLDLDKAASAREVFYSLNNVRECITLSKEDVGKWQRELRAQSLGWRRMMSAEMGEPPNPCGAYCCTQFIVSADRIRRRSHAFWRGLLADLLDQQVPNVCKVSGHMLELTWGYLLGEPGNFTCRKDGWGYCGVQPIFGGSRPRGDT